MKSPVILWAIATAAAALLASPTVSHSQDRTAAEAAFREGRGLMKKERFEEACEKFALSQRLDPAIGTLTNLGICHEKLGKLATAWAELNAAADLAAGNGQADRANQIRKRALALEPRLGRLLIEDKGDQSGISVKRDGADVSELLGTSVPIDPGTYSITASAEGKTAWEREVDVTEEGVTVTVEIPRLKPMIASKELGGDPAIKDGSKNRGKRLAALAIGAGGLVAGGGGVYFGLRARSRYSDSNAFCDEQNLCSQEGVDLRDSAFRNATASNILIGVGVAAVVGAGVLWYLSPSEAAEASESSTQLVPTTSGDQVGLMVQGTF